MNKLNLKFQRFKKNNKIISMNKNEAIEMTMKGFNWTLFTKKKKIYWNYQNGRKASKFVCVHITKEHNTRLNVLETMCAPTPAPRL